MEEIKIEVPKYCKGCKVSYSKCRWKNYCKRRKYYEEGYKEAYKQGMKDACKYCRYEEALQGETDVKQAIDTAYSNGRRDLLVSIQPVLEQAKEEKYEEGRRDQEIQIIGILRKAMPDKELLDVLKLHSAINSAEERNELYKYPLEED